MIWRGSRRCESVGSLSCSRLASVPGRPIVLLQCARSCACGRGVERSMLDMSLVTAAIISAVSPLNTRISAACGSPRGGTRGGRRPSSL